MSVSDRKLQSDISLMRLFDDYRVPTAFLSLDVPLRGETAPG
jgi:hypothetical protein